jgi:hypothetical protein
VVQRLQIGIEFNAVVREVNPLVTLFLLTEGDTRPGLFLGTSSDRIGSPEGATAYYATASKYHAGLGASAYASLNYSEWDEGFNLPFGLAKEIGGSFAARYMYDGQRSHALLDYYGAYAGVSLMWVWLEQFGVSVYFGF